MTYEINIACKECGGNGGYVTFDFDAPIIAGVWDIDIWNACEKCQGKRFCKQTFETKKEIENAVTRLLEHCDWYAEYSDSPEVRNRQNARLATIRELLSSLEKTQADILWKKYCPFQTRWT